MSSGRSSTPAGRSAAEKVTAKAISPEGSDSGYGSTANTADGSTTDHSQDFADGVAVRSRGFFERKVTKLRLFDREIPQLTQHRFHDLHELFERPLCDHLSEAKINPYPISLKLKCLGESEATAKPWIVVLCNKTASKKVRHFFNQQHIKADYQPSNPDSFLPSFEIFVCNRPPRPMAGADIYGDFDERSTMCGRIVKVGGAHQSRFATLGGVIRLIKPSGIVTLYGMTAGHILAQQPLGQYGFDQVDIHDEKDEEDEGYDSGEEEYELDDTFEGDEEAQALATTGNTTRTVSESTQLGPLWPKIGSVFATSNEGTTAGQDHDWALIEFFRVADYLPNLLVPFNRGEKFAKHRPLKERGKSTEHGSSRKIVLLSGTGGVKSGTLSTSLSFLMMGPAKAFAKTYTVVLSQGSMLNAGDCGSWVVDESTCEVYGHVVASDAMGDTYVVPLNTTLRDMEEKLGAAVSLATEADIHMWLAQQTKAAAEQITVPAGSKKKKVAFNDLFPASTPGPRPSRPTAPPLLSGLPESGRYSVTPSPRRAPSLVHRHESFHESISDSHHQSHNSSSGQVTYEGYTFTKYDTHRAGQNETWAVAQMVPMLVSQKDLKDQIKRNRKKHVSALDEYNDEKMKGFKRKQVDNLIRECTKVDGDYGYEYVLASIKLDSRKTKSKSTETVSMQVILKRQLVAGLPHETPAGPSTDFHARLHSQVMDLTSGDNLGVSRDYGGGSQDVGHRGANVPFAAYPEHGAFPMFVAPTQPFRQGVQHVDNGILPLHAALNPLEPFHSPAQGMRQPPHPHSGSLVHQNTPNLLGHLEKVDKSNPKNKVPKVHIGRESRIKHDYASSSPPISDHSAELDSDNSWTKTDATPDTVFTGQSREHRIEERSRKESKEGSRNKGRFEPTSSAHEIVRPVYCEHRRREPRYSSLSPARRSRDVSSDSFDLNLERHGPRPTSLRHSHGTRYRDLEHYEIEPAIGFRADSSFRRHRSSVSPERPSHRRALSYNLGRPLAHNSRALVSAHRETPRDFSPSIDFYDNVAERRREQGGWDWGYKEASTTSERGR